MKLLILGLFNYVGATTKVICIKGMFLLLINLLLQGAEAFLGR